MMMSSELLSMKKEDVVVPSPFRPRHRKLTIPERLAQRELSGLTTRRRGGGVNSSSPWELSSVVGWNTCRLQNMILAVGPGTPATAAATAAENHEDSSSSSSTSSSEEHDMDNDEEHDEEMEIGDGNVEIPRGFGTGTTVADMAERIVLDWLDHDEDDEEEVEEEIIEQVLHSGNFVPSIRHGGCINTATWLTSPWRLSLPGSFATAEDSRECPTQLITSGDDRVVKFWDVRHAMGSSSPLPGGRCVQCPFADMSGCKAYDWKKHTTVHNPLPGSVIPLATLTTGHRGNIFHVTPLDHHPGKVVTCAADGYLRMSDVESSSSDSSTIIVSPEYGQDDRYELLSATLLSLRFGMCFSHHFLNANTGLLCRERGLNRFDIRLPPREQSTRSLLGSDNVCKACAIWSASSLSSDDVDSAYVFVGGSSADVCLYDLRMTDGFRSRVVQKYRPRGLDVNSQVSVSGLDISKDKRELLVSYENDQIFTFPVFPNSSASRPSVDELADYCKSYNREHAGDDSVLSELAAYGGHLNRFTFLKNAKYAGPNDEFICTGSDSGRAWIYERSTGTVAAFLSADQSTCNGVVPHPVLPFFITYGIDSTAKLWRATNPVDRDADDSPLGRARRYHRHEYEKSPLVSNWAYVKATAASSIQNLETEEGETVPIYPDQFPPADTALASSILGGMLMRRRMFGLHGTRPSTIGNDLRDLKTTLRQNVSTCVFAAEEGDSEPVSSGLEDLIRRVATIRLRHQADERGLRWNAQIPWMLGSREQYEGKQLMVEKAKSEDGASISESTLYGNRFDRVPESPSDWIPYDPEMIKNSSPCGPRFNIEDYADFYSERYGCATCSGTAGDKSWIERHKEPNNEANPCESNEGAADQQSVEFDCDRALNLLHETASMLKEGGNAALQAGSLMEAARRYDRAITYSSVVFLPHPNANDEFMERCQRKWCPLRKVLVTSRLNLCIVLSNFDNRGAKEQATLALKELAPFCTEKGRVLGGKKLNVVHSDDEPISTYAETKELQAKAYFRLASVNFTIGDFDEAVEKFEECVKCMKDLSKEPDAVLLRRLGEAKRERAHKSKRQRKKVKRMLAQEASQEEGEDDDSQS